MSSIETTPQKDPEHADLVEFLDLDADMWWTRPAKGGHMAYNRYFLVDSISEYFVKEHDDAQFTDKKRAEHSKKYLQKEATYMKHIKQRVGDVVPVVQALKDDKLVLESLSEERGWYWRAPQLDEAKEKYINDVLEGLKVIEGIEPVEHKIVGVEPALDVLLKNGWQVLADKKPGLMKKASDWQPNLSPENQRIVPKLLNDLMFIDPSIVAKNLKATNKKTVLSHHDARQANIAWHPWHGVRFVDWSWADPGVQGADSTMFLIDLAKSGHDVSKYMSEHFNDDHAMLLMGYYLSRSLDKPSEGGEDVRFQQFTSAVTAYRLLQQNH